MLDFSKSFLKALLPDSNKIIYMDSIHSSLRCCEENWQMTWGDVKLARDADETKYLDILNDRLSQEPKRNLEISVQWDEPKAFATLNGPSERNNIQFNLQVKLLYIYSKFSTFITGKSQYSVYMKWINYNMGRALCTAFT